MSWRYVQVERDGPVTLVTIDRADAHNALNADAHLELSAVFDQFAADDEQWVAIITGAGHKAFCAGHDLKQEVEDLGSVTPASGFGGLAGRFDLDKPVIAAVNGIAMGGGFEIALACDLVVAAEHAVFALPEPRVGLAALAGGIQRLPQSIGLKHAMGMLLTGRRVTAREGLSLGFVNEVTDSDVVDCARSWAREVLACSPLSVRATKQAALRSLELSTEEAITRQWNLPAVEAMLSSEDAIEGPRAFAERRQPQWKAR